MILNKAIEHHEKDAIEEALIHLLKKVTLANVVRVKAGLQVLMTTDLSNFEAIISKTIQQELVDFKELILRPETVAPLSCQTDQGKIATLHYIKSFTLSHFSLLDERSTLLPTIETVTQSILGGERLKSVVHTSALRNVTTTAGFRDILEKQLKSKGYTGTQLEQQIQEASIQMAKLHAAIIEGDLKQVQKISEIEGVDINLPNPDGLSPLHLATREGHIHIVEFLVSIPNIQANWVNHNGWTALHFAARFGYTEIVKLLMKAPGIQINLVNSDGWTPLHWAAWHGYLGVVAALMSSSDLKINPRDSAQCTPLHWAARNGHSDVIALLLSAPDIEVNALDVEAKTPLHYAVSYDHIPATSSLLSTPKLNVNLQDIDGLTPLHWAARHGQAEMLNLLLSTPEIRQDIVDHNKMTALAWAKRNGHNELIPLFNTATPTNLLYACILNQWRKILLFFSRYF